MAVACLVANPVVASLFADIDQSPIPREPFQPSDAIAIGCVVELVAYEVRKLKSSASAVGTIRSRSSGFSSIPKL